MPAGGQDERSPLLQRSSADVEDQLLIHGFSNEDPDDPRQWSYYAKMINVAIISLMARTYNLHKCREGSRVCSSQLTSFTVLSPLASSMFTPGLSQVAADLNTSLPNVVGATTGYVVTLGVGPLILAPLSETFGRRNIYVWSFSIFSLLQIPTALSPNVATLIACRTVAGFFGSVGIANGGGTLSDMFVPSQRASIFGWYLLGPVTGPCLGPLFGGIQVVSDSKHPFTADT